MKLLRKILGAPVAAFRFVVKWVKSLFTKKVEPDVSSVTVEDVEDTEVKKDVPPVSQ